MLNFAICFVGMAGAQSHCMEQHCLTGTYFVPGHGAAGMAG